MGEERERRLTMAVIVWLVIVLHLYPTLGIAAMLSKLARGLRFLWPDPHYPNAHLGIRQIERQEGGAAHQMELCR